MLLESFSQTILRWLRIPPGTSLRKFSEGSDVSTSSKTENEYIEAIVDITVDDICIGESPLSVSSDIGTPENVSIRLDDICKELNTVVKWVAKDLCIKGVSVYKASINKKLNKLVLLPSLENYRYFISDTKEILAYTDDDKKPIEDLLIFINVDKSSFQKIEDSFDSKLAFSIVPTPMQVKNLSNTINKINIAENAISRYRAQLSRIARWVNVDVGLSQGDTQTTVVNSISSAINANSMDLSLTTEANTFDDNIPVIPNRKGLGKPEIQSDIPNANIKDLSDLDYYLSKLTLGMRFPATYMDFSKNLDSTAVSLIRGDLRYSKLCNSVATKIENTITDWVNSSKTFKKYHPVFTLTKLPSSEDDDVMAALDNYVDLASKVEDFVNGDGEVDLKIHRLRILQDLFASSTTSPALQSWFEDFKEYLQKSGNESEDKESDEDFDDLGSSAPSHSSGSDFSSDEGDSDFSEEPEGSEDLENNSPPDDVEFIEPQS